MMVENMKAPASANKKGIAAGQAPTLAVLLSFLVVPIYIISKQDAGTTWLFSPAACGIVPHFLLCTC